MPQRVRQTIYSLPKKRPKSGQKLQNAIKHEKMLLDRQKVEGNTVWIQNALDLNNVKLLRYGIRRPVISTKKTPIVKARKAA